MSKKSEYNQSEYVDHQLYTKLGDVAEFSGLTDALIEGHAIYEGSTLWEEAEMQLEKNLEVLYGYVVPDMEDSELGRICRDIAIDELYEYVYMAERELTEKGLDSRFKSIYSRLMSEYGSMVERHQDRLNAIQERIDRANNGEDVYLPKPRSGSEDARIVTLFNVVETAWNAQDQVTVKAHNKLVTTIAAFESMVQSGSIKGKENKAGVSYGRIYGYTDIRELELDDFLNAGDYTLEVGPGITEVITESQFIQTVTNNMGNSEEIKYRADNEIRHGRAQEFMDGDDSADVKSFIEMQHVSEEQIKKDLYEYGFRSNEEKDYHYNQIKIRFNQHKREFAKIMKIGARAYCAELEAGEFRETFATMKDLYQLCAGKLFKANVPVYDAEMKQKGTQDLWLLDWKAMRKSQRAELLAEYKEIKAQLSKRAAAKIKVLAVESEAILDKMKNQEPVTRDEIKKALDYAENEWKLNKRKIFSPDVYAAYKAAVK